MPDEKLTVAVSDPISADIQAVCAAVTAVFTFLATPEGRALVNQSINDTAAFRAWIKTAWTQFTNLLQGKV